MLTSTGVKAIEEEDGSIGQSGEREIGDNWADEETEDEDERNVDVENG